MIMGFGQLIIQPAEGERQLSTRAVAPTRRQPNEKSTFHARFDVAPTDRRQRAKEGSQRKETR
jgi:hypothetical protein